VSALAWLSLGVLTGLGVSIPVYRHLLRRAAKQVRDAERRARGSERLAELGAMTGGLAHEIKNPLSTVLLNGDLLREGLDDADVPQEQRLRLRKRLDALLREVERLRGILTDFLQFAGRIRLDPAETDLGAMIEELCDFFLPQCSQAGITLRPQVPATDRTAIVDANMLKQAILNIMINAVQAMAATRPSASPHGRGYDDDEDSRSRELMLRLTTDDHDAHIHVIDTGPGISAERLDEIFRPYVSSKKGGTGLGLPIARRIVEEHGGRIDAHSEPGTGSDFVITIPRRPSADAAPATAPVAE